jgi:hypothetical protein
MKKLIILILLLLPLLAISSNAAYFCMDESSAYYCLARETQAEFGTDCTGNIVDSDLVPEVLLTCDDANYACCCEDSKLKYKNQCSAEKFNEEITDATSCSTYCGTPTTQPPPECTGDPPPANLTLNHVKGEKFVSLTWDSCGSPSISIAKNTTPEIIQLSGPIRSFTDTSTQWGISYRYTITLTYLDGTIRIDTKTIRTGSPYCQNVYNNLLFCVHENFGAVSYANSGGTCNAQNQYTMSTPCPTGTTCTISSNTVVCQQESVCGANESLFGIFLPEDIPSGYTVQTYCENIGYCYYDRTSSGVNRCLNCPAPATNRDCFMYKTQSSCESDACDVGTGTCGWYSYDDFGSGICKSEGRDYCDYIAKPEGFYNVNAYTPLVTPVTITGTANYTAFFSTNDYYCSELLGSCPPAADAHCGLKDTLGRESCNEFTFCTGVTCAYLVDGKCTREAGYEYHPCTAFTGTNRTACEKDYFPPTTSLTMQNTTSQTIFFLQIYDKINKAQTDSPLVLSPYTQVPKYNTTLCIRKSSGGTELCQEYVGSLSIYLHNLTTHVFPSVVFDALESYTLSAKTTDQWGNVEEDFKSVTFTYPSTTPPPPPTQLTYNFTLLQPKGSVYVNENIIVDVLPLAPISGCEFSTGTSQYFPLKENGPLFTTISSFKMSADFNLTIRCNVTGSTTLNTRVFPISVISLSDIPLITGISLDPTWVHTKIMNQYQTTLKINTNYNTQCKYSLDTLRNYNQMIPGSNDDIYKKSHDIPINFTTAGNKTIYAQCATGTNSILTQVENITLVISSDAQDSGWINIEQPKLTTTDLLTYNPYNTSSIPVRITTANTGTCTAMMLGTTNINIPLQPTTPSKQFNGTINNIAETGGYTLSVTCTYEQPPSRISATKQQRFYVDLTRPNLHIFFDTKQGTGSNVDIRNYSQGTRYDLIYNDTPLSKNFQLAYYTIMFANDSGSNKVYSYIVNNQPMSTINPFAGFRNFTPSSDNQKQDYIYNISATLIDQAGNVQTRVSSTMLLLKAPSLCDISCGYTACPCGQGDSCDGGLQCSSGLVCVPVNSGGKVCAPSGCELPGACGGLCPNACIEKLWLIQPPLAVASTPSFTLSVGTLDNMLCYYENANTQAYNLPLSLMGSTSPKKIHTVSGYSFDSGQTSGWVKVTCGNGQENVTKTFNLEFNGQKPLITDFKGSEIITGITNVNGINGYWTTVTLQTDQDTICKYSLTSQSYAQMPNYVGGNKNESLINDYSKTNSGDIKFDAIGSYTIYAACKSRNGLISDTKTKNVRVDPSIAPVPEIVFPNNNSLRNNVNVEIRVNSRYEALGCEAGIGLGNWAPMTRAEGNVYVRNVTGTQGINQISARCSYLVGATQRTSPSSSIRVTIDTIPPVMTTPIVKDSYTGSVQITNYKGAVDVSVRANDATSGLYSYNYTLYVNSVPMTVGRTIADSYNDKPFNFTVQYPASFVKDNDSLSVRLVSEDRATNVNPTPLASNNLKYVYVAPPPECEQECGGLYCDPCGPNEACEVTADCEPGYDCITGKCQPKDLVCKNNAFDPEYETDYNCGKTCPACELGKKCNINSDCTSGFCDQTDKICKIDYKLMCENKKIDKEAETDLDCGAMCAQLFDKTCASGMFCQITDDCHDGLRCDSNTKKCVPEVCYNDKQDEGEEGWNCGGICPFACFDYINLVSPRFGIVSERSFNVTLNTTSPMTCSYRTSNMQAGILVPITSTKSSTHTIANFNMPLISNTVQIEVACQDNNIPRQRSFQIAYDPLQPEITLINAQPNPITAKTSKLSEGGRIAYWTDLNVRTSVPTFCRYSNTETSFEKMQTVLITGSNINNASSYETQRSKSFGFDSEGTNTINVACIAQNGKITPTKVVAVVANPNAQMSPLIVSPSAGSALNVNIFTIVVNSISNAEFCEAKINENNYTRLNLNGSVYTGLMTSPGEGSHKLTARCLYQGSIDQYYGSSTINIMVDLKAPVISKVVATDPNKPLNLTVTLHKTAVNITVSATDAISGIASFNYTILVNNNNVSSGRIPITNQAKTVERSFIDNELNLNDSETVKVVVTGRDVAGNVNAQGTTSNTLRYLFTPIPPSCVDKCGGECPACPVDESCKSDADCEGGLSCQSGVCRPKANVCLNKQFDEDKETDVDCGGICPGCDIGLSCISTEDCKTGLTCNQDTLECELDATLMCSNKKLDFTYETGIDCGGLCRVMLNLTCPDNQACKSNLDCTSGTCKNNVCVSSGPAPQDYCIENKFNNTMKNATTNATIYCGAQCSVKCAEGVGCRSTADCANGLACDMGVCKVSTIPESCIGSDIINSCGGNCPDKCGTGLMCKANSDCLSTHTCEDGKCKLRSTTITPQSRTGELGYPCFENGECLDELRCNKDLICEEKTGVSWVRIVLFIMLIALLVAIGYYAYITYYKPKDNLPPFLQDKNKKQLQDGKGTLPGLPLEPIKMDGNAHTLTPPQGTVPPPSPKVDALMERRRKEMKKEEMGKLFGAFEETALDDEKKSSDKTAKDVLKSVPKADFAEKPLVPVRAQSSEKTFKELIDEAKKEVADNEKKDKVTKVESKVVKKESPSDKKEVSKKETKVDTKKEVPKKESEKTDSKSKGTKDEKGTVR